MTCDMLKKYYSSLHAALFAHTARARQLALIPALVCILSIHVQAQELQPEIQGNVTDTVPKALKDLRTNGGGQLMGVPQDSAGVFIYREFEEPDARAPRRNRAAVGDTGLLADLELDTRGNDPVEYSFKDTRLINFHTIEVLGERTLDFRISHRFGNISSGPNGFFGVDGPASIRLGLEYSYDGRLMFGVGRSNVQKEIDGFLKYRLLYQTENNRMPLSVTALAAAGLVATKDPLGTNFPKFSHRLSYVYQLMLARKFTPWLSVQLSPTLVHFNISEGKDYKNDHYTLAGLVRARYDKWSAVTFEYGARLNKTSPLSFTAADPYRNSMSIGWEKETGGHVFSVHISNSFGIIEQQTLALTTDKWSKGQVKIGFNIRRVFSL